jgi:hypothetical protein
MSVADHLTANTGSLSGIQLDGTFAIEDQTALDLSNVADAEETLVLKLKETDRGTGSFVTLSAAAFLEVDVNLNSLVSFNASHGTDGQDDSFSLAQAFVGNKSDITGAAPAASQYRLDLHNYLAEAANLAANTEYDSVNKVLTSSWFPAGAIILDLDKDGSLADRITGNVQVSAANGDEKTFLVASDQLEAGVMLYGKVSIDCAAAMPTISGSSTFQPTGAVLGSDNGANAAGIKVVLTGLDNYQLAQVLTVAVEGGGQINITEALAPDQTQADIFEQVINLSDLIGAGTIGETMGQAVVAAIGTNANVIKSFSVKINAIEHDSNSDFSGFCRQLVQSGGGRTTDAPFLAGDKFIISATASMALPVTPYQYSFIDGQSQISGSIASIPVVQMFKSGMPVYSVLKQTTSGAPLRNAY